MDLLHAAIWVQYHHVCPISLVCQKIVLLQDDSTPMVCLPIEKKIFSTLEMLEFDTQ